MYFSYPVHKKKKKCHVPIGIKLNSVGILFPSTLHSKFHCLVSYTSDFSYDSSILREISY